MNSKIPTLAFKSLPPHNCRFTLSAVWKRSSSMKQLCFVHFWDYWFERNSTPFLCWWQFSNILWLWYDYKMCVLCNRWMDDSAQRELSICHTFISRKSLTCWPPSKFYKRQQEECIAFARPKSHTVETLDKSLGDCRLKDDPSQRFIFDAFNLHIQGQWHNLSESRGFANFNCFGFISGWCWDAPVTKCFDSTHVSFNKSQQIIVKHHHSI